VGATGHFASKPAEIFIVHAASRRDFVPGGLAGAFETSLNRFLEDFLTGEWRCALDPDRQWRWYLLSVQGAPS
jgi:hypothetical protein